MSVWPQVAIRGDMHRIRVGARTSVQDGSVLHITHAGPFNPEGWPLDIGCDVTIGHSAVLHGCTVGNRVLVGMSATVMDGVVVEDDVVIAAGALVTPGKRLRSGYLYAGSPAREVRLLSEKELAYFTYSANNYVQAEGSAHCGAGVSRLVTASAQAAAMASRNSLITGPRIRAHLAPDIKRLGGLLHQHAQAIRHGPGSVMRRPAHERRRLCTVDHVVATAALRQQRARQFRRSSR